MKRPSLHLLTDWSHPGGAERWNSRKQSGREGCRYLTSVQIEVLWNVKHSAGERLISLVDYHYVGLCPNELLLYFKGEAGTLLLFKRQLSFMWAVWWIFSKHRVFCSGSMKLDRIKVTTRKQSKCYIPLLTRLTAPVFTLLFLRSAWGALLCCRPPHPEATLPNLGPCLEPTTSLPSRRSPQTVSGRWDNREQRLIDEIYRWAEPTSHDG